MKNEIEKTKRSAKVSVAVVILVLLLLSIGVGAAIYSMKYWQRAKQQVENTSNIASQPSAQIQPSVSQMQTRLAPALDNLVFDALALQKLQQIYSLVDALPMNNEQNATKQSYASQVQPNDESSDGYKVIDDLKKIVTVTKKSKDRHKAMKLDPTIAKIKFKLLINEMRWAVVTNDPLAFAQSLANAQRKLERYFDLNFEVTEQVAQILNELAEG